MARPTEIRASQRLPIANRVQIVTKDKATTYALAINLSLGGILLCTTPSLAAGSACSLAIFSTKNAQEKIATIEGTIVRNNAVGTAIHFSNQLDQLIYNSIIVDRNIHPGNAILHYYMAYFKVSQQPDHHDSERYFGVSGHTFKMTVLCSFVCCILFAIFSVLFFRSHILAAQAWIKIVASFAYAFVWLGMVQPSIDIMAFMVLKQRRNTNQ